METNGGPSGETATATNHIDEREIHLMSERTGQVAWENSPPAENSYRSIIKYDLHAIMHPGDEWLALLRDEVGVTEKDFEAMQPTGNGPVKVDQQVRLSADQIAAFTSIVEKENVATDDYSRVKYGHGKSLDENLDLRREIVRAVPDAIIHPRNKEDVKEIVEYCHQQKIAIVPYGAGSGVVIGTRSDNGGITLVMRTHMNQVLEVNELNQTAVVQPGLIGPDYEAALNDAPGRYGTKLRYTCGHLPQSFELASVGGWISALGSGQASTYYGDAYEIVLSQEYVTPAGTFKTHDIPGTATGPKVNDMMKGSEGAYGVLVEVTLKIFRYLPENRQRFSYMFPNWEAAVDTSREISQGEFGLPAVFRISDAEETAIGLRLKGFNGSTLDKYLRFRGVQTNKRCLCVGTVEGEKTFARNVRKQVGRIARTHGAVSLGKSPVKSWEHGRYSGIHIRDPLLDYGIILDTLETGVTWENLHSLHQGVRSFVKKRPKTVCFTHASHFYPQGTNLYFIFILKPESPEEFYEFRSGVVERIVELGGSVSHHHGIGKMLAPWMQKFLGKEQMDILRAVKKHLDPHNIMNPGGQLGLNLPEESGQPAGGAVSV